MTSFVPRFTGPRSEWRGVDESLWRAITSLVGKVSTFFASSLSSVNGSQCLVVTTIYGVPPPLLLPLTPSAKPPEPTGHDSGHTPRPRPDPSVLWVETSK